MTRLVILFSSFAPMLLLIAIRISEVYASVSWCLAGVAVGLTVALTLALRARHKTSAQPFTVEAIKDEGPQYPAYLLTYVFPFAFATVGDGEI